MLTKTIDLIIRLKNGYMARNERIAVPYSKMNMDVLNILKNEHYIDNFELTEEGPKKYVFVDLLYDNGDPVLTDVKIVSKPGKRLYTKVKEFKLVLGGVGIGVVTTSQGIMTQSEARKKNIGGEILFKVW
ncbi:MAG TPA: 30S ribosomal protein S8 [Candidatus Nitrosocosmicus sp.]|nr:30S ribosomal protein S8 [Candidatus Nitrosocosmicus sp.]